MQRVTRSGRARLPRAALVGALAGVSCMPEVDLEVPGASADTVVIVAVVEGGRVTAAHRIRAGAVSLPAEGERVVMVIPRADLIGADARAVREDLLAGLEARRASDPGPVTGCGRCLAPDLDPRDPVIVQPGSSCPPARRFLDPAFVARDPIIAEQVRLAIRLDWPGECPCEEEPIGEPPPMSHRLIAAAGGLLEDPPFDRFALSGQGTLLLAALDRVEAIEPSRVHHRGPPSTSPRSFGVREVGPVAALDDTRFVMVGRGGAGLRPEAKWVRYDLTPGGIEARGIDVITNMAGLFDPKSIAALEEGHRFLLYGSRIGAFFSEEPSVLVCDDTAGLQERWACADTFPTRLTTGDDSFTGGVVLPDGAVVSIADEGAVQYLEGLPPRGVQITRSSPTPVGPTSVEGWLELSDGGRRRWRVQVDRAPEETLLPGEQEWRAAGSLGQRVFACVTGAMTSTEGVGTVVLSKLVTAGAIGRGELGEWAVSACLDTRCGGLARTSSTSTTAQLFLGSTSGQGTPRVLLLDGDGRVLSPVATASVCRVRPPAEPSVDRAMETLQASPLGWTALKAVDSAVFLRRGAQPFSRVYGQAVPGPPHYTAEVAIDDAFLLFSLRGGVREVDVGSATVRTSSLPPQGARPPLNVLAAARDSSFESSRCPDCTRVLVAGVVQVGEGGVVRRMVVQPGRDLVDDVEPVDLPVPPLAMAEVAPGLFVIVADQNRLFRVDGRGERLEVLEIEILDRDPVTGERSFAAEALSRPENLEGSWCETRPAATAVVSRTPQRDWFRHGQRSVSAQQGVAWVAGCNASLLRVYALGAEPRAYPLVLRPGGVRGGDVFFVLDRGGSTGRPLSSVRATCADRLWVSARAGQSELIRDSGFFSYLGAPWCPASTQGSAVDLDPVPCPAAMDGSSGDALTAAGLAIDLFTIDGHLGAAFTASSPLLRNGILRLLDAPPALRLPLAFDVAAASERGQVLIGTEGGVLIHASKR
ncbi:MAG: hypothetical protein IT384_19010 [Deltaproteobacteria bacterium]|nr:hypothetical protein [Deltaproteobacteria bacterium]